MTAQLICAHCRRYFPAGDLVRIKTNWRGGGYYLCGTCAAKRKPPKPIHSIALSALLAGCAAAPHVADTGISRAVLLTGGSELNPLRFHGVVVAKIAAEGIAESYRQAGDRYTCARIAGAARLGSWVGTGATLGGLAGGPIWMGVGALFALLAGDQPARESAFQTCYGPRGSVRVVAGEPAGWGG